MGDGTAFDALTERFQERVRENIALQLRPESGVPLDVEEVLQETFVKAFKSLGRFEWQNEDSFYLWLCGIARNVMLIQRKKARRERRLEFPEQLAGSGTSPSRMMRRRERMDRLEIALSKLSPEYREALRLSRLKGLRVKEIAQRMNRTECSVSHLLARGTMELKKLFGDTESLHLPHQAFNVEGEDDGDE